MINFITFKRDRAAFVRSKSATADWVGSDTTAKPQHLMRARGTGTMSSLRRMGSGDYLARNVKLARERLLLGYVPAAWTPHCVGPEHDH